MTVNSSAYVTPTAIVLFKQSRSSRVEVVLSHTPVLLAPSAPQTRYSAESEMAPKRLESVITDASAPESDTDTTRVTVIVLECLATSEL